MRKKICLTPLRHIGKKTWLLSWPSSDSCFVLFCFFAMYFLSGPAGQTAFFLLFSAPKLWLKLS